MTIYTGWNLIFLKAGLHAIEILLPGLDSAYKTTIQYLFRS